MKQESEAKNESRRAIVSGCLTFAVPYGGRAKFDWWLDRFGRDVIVECMEPWKGLREDIHQIGMGPKFTPAEARRLAEALSRRILSNLDHVVRNRNRDDLKLGSYYDNQQLPLYRKWAWEEEKRRYLEVGLLADAIWEDDADDDSPLNERSSEFEERAEAELRAEPIELVGEVGPIFEKEAKNA